MDRRKSILNVSISIGFKLVIVVLSIVVRRVLIQSCGNEINGLNALYLSIVGFLAVAELGVGGAITFCMYKPIVEGNENQVSALYQLFRKLYLIIGAVILLAGLVITPFIHYFAKDYAALDVDLYGTFVLILISIVLTYGFSAKTSLINAYKNNYITTAITSGGLVLQSVLQITILLLTQSFAWYLGCRIAAVLAQWAITEAVVRKKYAPIISNKQKLGDNTAKGVKKNVKAMFMHKIGGLLVNTADNLIISIFVGVIALGYYSNYITILNAVSGILALAFSSLTSVVGHLYVKEDVQTTEKYCGGFHTLNFLIGMVFFLGYYAIADNLVAIFFGAQLQVEKSVSFTIALNGFVQFMRQSVLLFRDATGTFYNDRWKPLVEGSVNVVLSILLVNWVGVTGVIVATIVTNLLICHVIEPYVLYKNAFFMSPKRHYIRNYIMIGLFLVALLCMHVCLVSRESQWMELLINGVISVCISGGICTLFMLKDKESRSFIRSILKRKQ